MRRGQIGLLVLVGLAVVAVANTFYSVSETQQAILLQFGAPKDVIQSAGLNVKIPFLQNVIMVDKRILSVEQELPDVPDKDRQRLVVDAFARYRIVDPLKYYQSRVTEENIKYLLSSAVRSVIASTTIFAVLSEERDHVMGAIKADLSTAADAQYGIKIVDVRIRRTDLPEQNRESIVNRMVQERTREANELRAEGTEISNKITAEADKDATVILAEANRQSEVTKGEGDAQRNQIYADAYSRDPEFFAFYRSMIAYQKALGHQDTTMVISPTSEFFQFLGNDRGK